MQIRHKGLVGRNSIALKTDQLKMMMTFSILFANVKIGKNVPVKNKNNNRVKIKIKPCWKKDFFQK